MSNNINWSRLNTPIVTGKPQIQSNPVTSGKEQIQSNGPSFQSILNGKLQQESGITFSKHAVARAEERNIDLSESSMARLQEGVRLAEEKGLNDTLILVDKTAFIVNIKNSKVITTVSHDDLKGNVFTNIDGTVVI